MFSRLNRAGMRQTGIVVPSTKNRENMRAKTSVSDGLFLRMMLKATLLPGSSQNEVFMKPPKMRRYCYYVTLTYVASYHSEVQPKLSLLVAGNEAV